MKDGVHYSSEHDKRLVEDETHIDEFLSIWRDQTILFSFLTGHEERVLHSDMVDYLVVLHYPNNMVRSVYLADRNRFILSIGAKKVWIGLFDGQAHYYREIERIYEQTPPYTVVESLE